MKETISYTKTTQMGMEIVIAKYKGVIMTLAEGPDWVSIYSCDSRNGGKGEVQSMVDLIKQDFKNKKLHGSVPLNSTMEHIYKKKGVNYEK